MKMGGDPFSGLFTLRVESRASSRVLADLCFGVPKAEKRRDRAVLILHGGTAQTVD